MEPSQKPDELKNERRASALSALFERPPDIRPLLLNDVATPMIAATVVAVFLVWILSGRIPANQLFLWLCAVVLINAARFLVFWVTARTEQEANSATIYWFTGLTFVAGSIWGVAGAFMVPAEPLELRVVLSFCLGGLVAGTVAGYSYWLPAFFAFALPAMLPISIQFLMGGQDTDTLMGVLLIVYTMSVSLLALNFNRTLRRTMSLQETLGGVERLIGSVFSNLPFPAAVKSAEYKYILVNEAFAQRRQNSIEELIGKTPEEVFEPETAEFVRAHDQRVVEAKQAEIMESEIAGADGLRRNYLSIKYPVLGEDQSVTSIVSLDIDITNLKQTEMALQQSKETAEVANRAKTEFLTNMSHELRTPLNSIIGFSDVLQTEALGPLSPKYREYASDINRSGGHLLALISDILDVSKIEAGEIEIDEEDFDLPGLMRDTVRMVHERAERKGITLSESDTDAVKTIHADPLRLKQVLLNVLTNAIKFTPNDGKIDVAIGLDETTEAIVISVQDTGIGIEARDIPRVVEPFIQIANPNVRTSEGTGLGLTLARAFIVMHGGSLDIESEPQVGTKVSVRLPVSRLRP